MQFRSNLALGIRGLKSGNTDKLSAVGKLARTVFARTVFARAVRLLARGGAREASRRSHWLPFDPGLDVRSLIQSITEFSAKIAPF
jgi:hypothetical protein